MTSTVAYILTQPQQSITGESTLYPSLMHTCVYSWNAVALHLRTFLGCGHHLLIQPYPLSWIGRELTLPGIWGLLRVNGSRVIMVKRTFAVLDSVSECGPCRLMFVQASPTCSCLSLDIFWRLAQQPRHVGRSNGHRRRFCNASPSDCSSISHARRYRIENTWHRRASA